MPDFGSPVAQNIQPPDLVKTASGLLSLMQQKQTLQRGAAETQMTQQTAQQRASIANIDWSKYDDGTGAVSTDKMLSDEGLRKAAGDSFLDVVKQGAAVRGQQMQNKQALVALNDGLRSQFGTMTGALSKDPDVLADNPTGRQKVRDAMQQFAEAGGPDAQRVVGIYGSVVDHAPQGKLARSITATQLQAMDASRQAAAQQPQYTNTGGVLVQTNPMAAGAEPQGTPAHMPVTLAPQVVMDAAGQPHVIGGGAGTPSGQSPAAPAQGQQQAPQGQQSPGGGSSWVNKYQAIGQAAQVENNAKNINDNRNIAKDAQIQRDILGRIQALAATPGLYLGPGSRPVADLATTISQIPGFEGAAKYANNYNELTKFMAQNAARQGASLGLSGSDARLDAANHANPNADPMDKRTVQGVAQYLSGVVRMGLAKADAMDRWLQQQGNTPETEHQFERLWRDNADPRLFQLAEMQDQGEAKNYAKLHIRPGEMKALQEKHDALAKLGVF